MRLHVIFFIFLTFSSILYAEEEPIGYRTEFSGINDKDLLFLFQKVSHLIKLEKHPPKTQAGLRRRIETDIPNFIKVLHSQSYYNAKITYEIDLKTIPYLITFSIDPGPSYPFEKIAVYPDSLKIQAQDVGICLGNPAYTADIINAEEKLIHLLAQRGYPLAKITKKDVIADQQTKTISVNLYAEPGPLALFGDIIIEGGKTVKKPFIYQKIDWKYGEVYNPAKMESTVLGLEASGVFSSIAIIPGEEVDSEGMLPVTIMLTEGKQRSLGLGAGYSTQRGPGFTAEWEHRNYRGMGEKLSLNINALMDTQEATISYHIPDFLERRQDLIYALEVEHDDTKGYEKSSFSLSGTIEKQLTDRVNISYGAMYELLNSTKEKKDGKKKDDTYNLIRTPLKFRWSSVEDFLDPQKGGTLFLKAVPTVQLNDKPFFYTITTLTASIYKPFSRENRLILALKAYIGSIWGTTRNAIPGSERFNAGSENTLRGYSYQTVSPLSEDGDPMGGRSLMIYSLESRWRISEDWGAVLFYDAGNVYSELIPQINSKILQSAGLGIRYYTPVGPLRLDIAYPINRRRIYDKKEKRKRFVDSPYQAYFSVGQAF